MEIAHSYAFVFNLENLCHFLLLHSIHVNHKNVVEAVTYLVNTS